MKLKIKQVDLVNTLSTACLAVSTRPTNPILNNLLLEANVDQQNLSITAFDQNLGIRVFVDCSVESSGVVALPAKLLDDVISHLDKCEVTLEIENFTATITHNSGKCRIQGADPTEFPKLPETPNNTLTISAVDLLNALKATIFAAGKDSFNMVLAGIHLNFTHSTWEAAATDGHRLAFISGKVESKNTDAALEPVEATVPYQTFAQLEKILTDISCCNCIINIGGGIVSFELPNIRVTSRLLEGQYPNYSVLIPTQFQYQFSLDKKPCDNALKRVSYVAEQKNKVAKIAFDFPSKSVTVSAESASLGGAVEALPFESETEECENLEIGFNIKYFLDAIKVTTTDKILFKANHPDQPALITPVNCKSNHLIMIMPVQIKAN